MSEIRTFGLENRIKFISDFRRSDFRHSGCSVRSIVRLYYKCPKSESSVGRDDQPNVWNPNCGTLESAEIWIFVFQTVTVFINDVTQGIRPFLTVCMKFVSKTGEGQKILPFAWRHLWTFPKYIQVNCFEVRVQIPDTCNPGALLTSIDWIEFPKSKLKCRSDKISLDHVLS